MREFLSRPGLVFALPLMLMATLLASAARAAPVEPPYIVFDVGSGEVLAEHDAFAPWYPASLTKMMTAYVVFEALARGEVTLSSPVTMSAHAAAQAPSKMGFKPGTAIALDDALKMLIVKSANDIAVAIAESIAGSEPAFAARMNDASRRLGMTASRWNNPNGLPDAGQWTSARDLAILTRALVRDHPRHADYFRIQSIAIGDKVMKSQNKMLTQYAGTDGMKTGFVCASGFNLVATASRGGRRIAAIVLGQPNAGIRNERAARLIEAGFSAGSGFTSRNPTLERLRPLGPVPSRPFDLRPYVCGEATKAARAEKAPGPALLGPVVAAAAPVRVGILGGAAPVIAMGDGEEGEVSGIAATAVASMAAVPLPPRRPVPLVLRGPLADPAAVQ